jgi:hypothetical protein
MERIVFDIETEPFGVEFREAKSGKARAKWAPRIRVACTYSESSGKYRFWGSHEARSLIRVLQSADELVSFNGKNFDLPVLRRHGGLLGRTPRKGRHIDLCEIMTRRAGFRVSLDAAARANFGEKKHTAGRKMEMLNPKELQQACRSDVSQTYRLFQQYTVGNLAIPGKSGSRNPEEKSYSSLPNECSSCGAHDCLEEIGDWDTEVMTEGQLAGYFSGDYGTALCRKCGVVIDWGF